MNKYKWQIINETAFEKETNTSFNVNADSEYSTRFKQYINDGGQVDPADVEPTPVKRWTSLEFIKRFTDAERTAIIQSVDVNIRNFWVMAACAQEIVANNSDTVAGMEYLVCLGILTEARKNEILS